MRRLLLALALPFGPTGCQSCVGIDPDPHLASDSSADVSDAASRPCDPNGIFDEPLQLLIVNTTESELTPVLTDDELNIFYISTQGNPPNMLSIWTASRTTIDEPFSSPHVLRPRANSDDVAGLALSSDALTLYFSNFIPKGGVDGSAVRDIFYLERPNVTAAFSGDASFLSGASTPENKEFELSMARTSGDLYIASQDDIYQEFNIKVSARFEGRYGVPQQFLNPNDSSTSEHAPVISFDELELYYARRTAGGPVSTADVWVTRRKSRTAAWDPPQVVPELSAEGRGEYPSWLSADGCRMYMSIVNGSDGWDIYVANRR